ncbi:MAG: AI-2E family transporter [Thermonemataceae bacterium]
MIPTKGSYSFQQRKRAAQFFMIFIGLFLLYYLRNYFNAFFGAIVIYTLLRSLHHRLVTKKGWASGWSSVLMLLISFLMFVLPISLLVYQVSQRIMELSRDKDLFDQASTLVSNSPIQEYIEPDILQRELEKLTNRVVSVFSKVLNNLISITAQLALMYFLLYFMFAHYRKMEAYLMRYAPFSRRDTIEFARYLKTSTYSNVIGQGIISFVQGSLVGVGFLIFGIADPFMYGLIAIFASFIPIVGSALVFVPGGLYLFATGQLGNGVGILLWGFGLVANIDNLLRLFINKYMGNIHPIVTFLGIIVGLSAFGIVGLVIGPLLISYFMLLVRIYTSRYLFRSYQRKK